MGCCLSRPQDDDDEEESVRRDDIDNAVPRGGETCGDFSFRWDEFSVSQFDWHVDAFLCCPVDNQSTSVGFARSHYMS